MIQKVKIVHTLNKTCKQYHSLIAVFKFNKKNYCLEYRINPILSNEYQWHTVLRPDKKMESVIFSTTNNKKSVIHAININSARKYYKELILDGFSELTYG